LNQSVHAFHFAGHAEFDAVTATGEIILEEATSRAPAPIDAQTLALNLARSQVRLALLSACDTTRQRTTHPWGGLAAALVGAGVPAVVGMQFPVEDESAVAFSRAFYGALSEGLAIDAAMSRARIAVRTGDALEAWGIPVLYLRANETDDTILFPRERGAQFVASWPELATRAWRRSDQFIEESAGSDRRRGVFQTELYVRRVEVEDALNKLLDGPRPALILTGESGAGKTNVLCQWVSDLKALGHAVLLYNCGALPSTDLEWEIERDIGAPEGTLLDALGHVDRLARADNHFFVIALDALNDFRGEERQSPLALLKRVNALVSRLPGDTRVRIVVSCSSAAWSIIQRRNQPALATSRFATRDDGEITIPLGRFSRLELEAAYVRYQRVFPNLPPLSDLPVSVSRQIDTPFLLRILAEATLGDAGTAADSVMELGIIGAYYARRVQRLEDQRFLELLVKRMYARQEALLSLQVLAEDEQLWREVREEDPESSWSKLLSDGVLTLRERDKGPGGKLVCFTFPMVGSLVLAMGKAKEEITADIVRDLVARSPKFPLAWDAGRMLLERIPNTTMPALLFRLASTPDPECRELIVAMLVERHRSDPVVTKAFIRGLLAQDSERAQRTSLKAAYCIGADARDIFVEAAESGNHALRAAVKDTLCVIWRNEAPSTRRATTDTLYVIWRRNPGFTLEFMRELVTRLTPLKSFTVRRRILALFIELSITIYVNHCDKQEVIDQTVKLYRELADRLDLPGVKHFEETKKRLFTKARKLVGRPDVSARDDGSEGWPGPLARILVGVLATAFARPILDTMFPDDLLPANEFFQLDRVQRAPLARIADYVDPSMDLSEVRADLATLLASEHQVFAIAGALVLAIHLVHDRATSEPLVRELFRKRDPGRRLWILFSLCVLFSEASPEFCALAEELTRTYLRDHPGTFYGTDPGPGARVLKALDFLFMPLGLANGKRGEDLALFRELIGVHRKFVPECIARCIRALAPVGFYYPDPVLRLLRDSMTSEDFNDPVRRDALFDLLGTMRTLHVEQVEQFLQEIELDDARPSIAAAADVARVHSYISAFGFFNNAVHFAIHYEPMRQQLSREALLMLSKAPSRDRFLVKYANIGMRMFFDADFDLRRWMGTNATTGRPPSNEAKPL
jgi:CHAT domain-containing protein